jgi:hypothetical protein
MGAVTAIMYGDRDPSIAGMVLDSPFSSLKLLVEELVKDKVSLPNFIVNQALKLVKSTVSKKANFKLDDIEPIDFAKRCYIPSLFVAAKDDNFVKPHHAKYLNDVYPGDKNLISIDGDHNSMRPRFFKDSAAIFFYNTLQVEYIKEISDNYAGFQYVTTKKEENLEINDKNVNIKSNDNLNANIVKTSNKNNMINDYFNKDIDLLSNNLDGVDILDNEEEIFQKILELSKQEYEDHSTNNEKPN